MKQFIALVFFGLSFCAFISLATATAPSSPGLLKVITHPKTLPLTFQLEAIQKHVRLWKRSLVLQKRKQFFSLSPGSYRLKQKGTTAFYPLTIKAKQTTTLTLSSVQFQTPAATQSTHFFFYNVPLGHLALAATSGHSKVFALFPGTYKMQRDRSTFLTRAFTLSAGQHKVISLGTLVLSPSTKVQDDVFFVLTHKGLQKALATRLYDGAQPLLPGRYWLQRQRSSYRYGPILIRPGQWTTVPGSTLHIVTPAQKDLRTTPNHRYLPPKHMHFFVKNKKRRKIALADLTKENKYFLFPGHYTIQIYIVQNKKRILKRYDFAMDGDSTKRIHTHPRPKPKPPYLVQVRGFKATHEKTSVTLRWDKLKDRSLAGYRIYRLGGRHPIHGTAPLPQTGYVDRGLSSHRTYHYVIRAVNHDGVESKGTKVSIKLQSNTRKNQ